jgi:hypothetical protein
MSDIVIEQLLSQAATSPRLDSPFVGGLCRLLAERLDRSSAFGRRILDWSGNPHSDALALRACGALHALVRSGREPDLTAAYPPAPFDPDRLWDAITGALSRHDDLLTAFLDSPPQTNEVARSGLILGGALHLAARIGLPLAIYEIGSSAGLNLAFDEYRYDLGNDVAWGASDAPLTVATAWRGALPPLEAPLRVVSRQGCDRNPLDPANPADADRLMAYIWPDQAYRLARTAAALALAAAEGRKPERLDAASWVEREFAKPQEPGTCRLLLHTIVWQYLPEESQARITAVLEAAAIAATRDAPVAHLGVEPDALSPDADKGAGMRLTIWPSGDVYELGRGDFHGRWADWAEL